MRGKHVGKTGDKRLVVGAKGPKAGGASAEVDGGSEGDHGRRQPLRDACQQAGFLRTGAVDLVDEHHGRDA